MEKYCKPMVTSYPSIHGLIPAAAAIVGLSAAKLMVAGVAAGLAVGAASSSRNIHFDSTISQSLQ